MLVRYPFTENGCNKTQARAQWKLEEAVPAEGDAYVSMEPNIVEPVTHGKREYPREDTEEGSVKQDLTCLRLTSISK